MTYKQLVSPAICGALAVAASLAIGIQVRNLGLVVGLTYLLFAATEEVTKLVASQKGTWWVAPLTFGIMENALYLGYMQAANIPTKGIIGTLIFRSIFSAPMHVVWTYLARRGHWHLLLAIMLHASYNLLARLVESSPALLLVATVFLYGSWIIALLAHGKHHSRPLIPSHQLL